MLPNNHPTKKSATSKVKLIAAILVAFAALLGSVGSAFRIAGVASVVMAHLLIFAGWVGFMASVIFIEHVLLMPLRQRVKWGIVVGLCSFGFSFGMDRWMMNLKAQQDSEKSEHQMATASTLTAPANTTSSPSPLSAVPSQSLSTDQEA